MNKVVMFIMIIFAVGLSLGLITQSSSATDIENASTQIINGFFELLEFIRKIGDVALKSVMKTFEVAKTFWEMLKDSWNYWSDKITNLFN